MKPSELIKLGLKDLEKCENDERFSINMGHWVKAASKKCYVCLAGAVMVQTLEMGFYPGKTLCPLEAPSLNAELHALNLLRQGFVGDGLRRLGYDPIVGDRSITRYEYHQAGFKEDMNQLVLDLEKEGL